VTAGDAAERVGGTADQRSLYWHAREAGSRAAYALMSGVRNSWDQSHVLVGAHRIVMFTLVANPKVSLMFLRLQPRREWVEISQSREPVEASSRPDKGYSCD
jgi:hypothetical protein